MNIYTIYKEGSVRPPPADGDSDMDNSNSMRMKKPGSNLAIVKEEDRIHFHSTNTSDTDSRTTASGENTAPRNNKRATATISRIDASGEITDTTTEQAAELTPMETIMPKETIEAVLPRPKGKSKKKRETSTHSSPQFLQQQGKRTSIIHIQARDEFMIFNDDTDLVSHITTPSAVRTSPLEDDYLEVNYEEFEEEGSLFSAITMPKALRKKKKKKKGKSKAAGTSNKKSKGEPKSEKPPAIRENEEPNVPPHTESQATPMSPPRPTNANYELRKRNSFDKDEPIHLAIVDSPTSNNLAMAVYGQKVQPKESPRPRTPVSPPRPTNTNYELRKRNSFDKDEQVALEILNCKDDDQLAKAMYGICDESRHSQKSRDSQSQSHLSQRSQSYHSQKSSDSSRQRQNATQDDKQLSHTPPAAVLEEADRSVPEDQDDARSKSPSVSIHNDAVSVEIQLDDTRKQENLSPKKKVPPKIPAEKKSPRSEASKSPKSILKSRSPKPTEVKSILKKATKPAPKPQSPRRTADAPKPSSPAQKPKVTKKAPTKTPPPPPKVEEQEESSHEESKNETPEPEPEVKQNSSNSVLIQEDYSQSDADYKPSDGSARQASYLVKAVGYTHTPDINNTSSRSTTERSGKQDSFLCKALGVGLDFTAQTALDETNALDETTQTVDSRKVPNSRKREKSKPEKSSRPMWCFDPFCSDRRRRVQEEAQEEERRRQ